LKNTPPLFLKSIILNFKISKTLPRKIRMQEVITGTKIDLREITGFCEEELFGGTPKVKRIGFGR
jgi:hypothetical protein